MKKSLILLVIFLVFGFSFSVGYYLYKVNFPEHKVAKEQIEENNNSTSEVEISKHERRK